LLAKSDFYNAYGRAAEANQKLLRNQEALYYRGMPEGVDISSITCIEDIKSCIESIEQEEVINGCYGSVCRALIRINACIIVTTLSWLTVIY